MCTYVERSDAFFVAGGDTYGSRRSERSERPPESIARAEIDPGGVA